jgi:pentatricopeptide repeat protein
MGIPDAGRTPPRRTVRRQPQPKKPVQRQNDAYRELNNRLIAACNANNMDSASQIYNEMQRRGIPVAPEARQAMDAFVDREVDRMVDPLRQSLGGMR